MRSNEKRAVLREKEYSRQLTAVFLPLVKGSVLPSFFKITKL